MKDHEKYQQFLKRLQTQIVYFKNSYEDAVIKSVPGSEYTVKFRGKPPFKAGDSNSVVAEATLEHAEITKAEYDAF